MQCPKCRKFMLVEDHERGKVVACLLCKAPIRVGGGGGVVPGPVSRKQTPPPRP